MIKLEPRPQTSRWWTYGSPLLALGITVLMGVALFAVLGKDPVTGEAYEGGAAEVIGGFMTMIGQQELWQNIQNANAIPRAFAWFKTAMKGLMGLVTSIPTRSAP